MARQVIDLVTKLETPDLLRDTLGCHPSGPAETDIYMSRVTEVPPETQSLSFSLPSFHPSPSSRAGKLYLLR